MVKWQDYSELVDTSLSLMTNILSIRVHSTFIKFTVEIKLFFNENYGMENWKIPSKTSKCRNVEGIIF